MPYFPGLKHFSNVFDLGKLQACEFRSLRKCLLPAILELGLPSRILNTFYYFNLWYAIISKDVIGEDDLEKMADYCEK